MSTDTNGERDTDGQGQKQTERERDKMERDTKGLGRDTDDRDWYALGQGHRRTARGTGTGAYPGGMHRMHVHPPFPPCASPLPSCIPRQVGNKKKTIKIFLKSIKFCSVQFQFYF